VSDRDSIPAGPPAPAPGDLASRLQPPQSVMDEFAHIPSRGRPPIVAIVAAVLALFLAVRLRHDVAYALSASTPIEISDARTLGSAPLSDLPLNRYVRLRGRPERESAVVLDTKGSWKFTQFFRLRGTQGRVFVRRVADPLPVPLAERDVFTGRLVRFSELSFADSIAQYFAAHVSGTHFFAPEALAAALARAQPTTQLVDRAGETVTLRPTDRLALDVARPEQYRIELLPERRGELARVRTLIGDHGGTITEQPDDKAGAADAGVAFTATIPAARLTETLSALGGLGRGIRFRPARDTLEVPVADLSASPGDKALRVKSAAGERLVPLERLIAARTRAAVEVPEGAVLLVEGEAPSSEIKSLVVLAFLAAFAAVNLLSLRRVR
jgi:hypothetical protein